MVYGKVPRSPSFAILDFPGLVLGSVLHAGEDIWTFDEFILGHIEHLVGLLKIPGALLCIKCEVLSIEVHVSRNDDVAFFLHGEDNALVVVESGVNGFVGGIIGPFLSDIGVVSLFDEDAVGSGGFWSKCIRADLNSHLLVVLWNQIEAFTFLHASWVESFDLRVSVQSLLAANKLEFIFEVEHISVDLWRAAHVGDLSWAHLLDGNVPALGNLVVTDLEKGVFAVAFL